jgi:3-oxoacyl-[acyl-carrier protein] reductase
LRRVALVTGASRGIGAAAARGLASDGFAVACQYFSSADAAEEVAADCRRLGAEAQALAADLGSVASVARLKQRLDELGWEPSVVVHCAGIARYGLLDDTDEQEWDEVMNVHLKGAYALTRSFAPAMRWRRWGRMVHLSSIWGAVGASGEAAYAASKGGLNAFTKSMARELASSGVTVNAIAPGAIDTDMLAALTPEERQALCQEIPLGRLGHAEEVAQLVRFLVSEEASYITGQVLGVNGGWHM